MPKSSERVIVSFVRSTVSGVLLASTVVAFAFAALAAAVSPTSAGTETGFAFLNLPPGVRGAAMGGTGVTTADGPGLVFWNPAGAAPAVRRSDGRSIGQVGAFHHESILTFRQDVVGASIQKAHDGLALGFNAHYTEAIEQRDDLGNLLGDFGIDDFAFAAGYGALVGEGLRLGGALQWTRESIAGDAASAFSIAGGLLYAANPATGKGLSLGASFKNLGPSPSFKRADGSEGESVSQPFTMSAGFEGFDTPGAFLQVNRALKARVDVYMARLDPAAAPAVASYTAALTSLAGSAA